MYSFNRNSGELFLSRYVGENKEIVKKLDEHKISYYNPCDTEKSSILDLFVSTYINSTYTLSNFENSNADDWTETLHDIWNDSRVFPGRQLILVDKHFLADITTCRSLVNKECHIFANIDDVIDFIKSHRGEHNSLDFIHIKN